MKRMVYLLMIWCSVVASGWAQKAVQAEVWLAKGDSCVKAFHPFAALQYYEQAYCLHANHATARKLAGIYFERGEYAKCGAVLERIPVDSLTHADLRLQFRLNRQLDTDTVLMVGQRILQKYPYDSEVVAIMAGIYNKKEAPEKAMSYVLPYLQTDSTNFYVNEQYAYALYEMKQYDRAARQYDRLLKVAPRNSSLLYYGGLSWDKCDSLEKAYTYLNKAAQIEKTNPYILVQAGIIATQLQMDRESADHLEVALLMLEPDKDLLFRVYSALATDYERLKRYKECITALDKCMSFQPTFAYLVFRKAVVYGYMGQTENERQCYEEYVKRADEMENPSKSTVAMLQIAKMRLARIKEEHFFKGVK